MDDTHEPQPIPTFEVRFVAPDISPEKISLRHVSDALSAVQDLAAGRDPFETPHVPPEKGTSLIDVRRGSAVYQVVSRSPEEAINNLRGVGALLTGTAELRDDLLVAALRPIESLSHVARAIHCRIDVVSTDGRQLLSIAQDDYKRVSSNLMMHGDTTVVGKIERVGGATGMRCLMRIPGRRRLLYCDVENRDLVRRLGQHLYEEIAATGKATWIHRTWRLFKFVIRDFSQPQLGDPDKAIEEFRKAGLNAWDDISDPDALIRG